MTTSTTLPPTPPPTSLEETAREITARALLLRAHCTAVLHAAQHLRAVLRHPARIYPMRPPAPGRTLYIRWTDPATHRRHFRAIQDPREQLATMAEISAWEQLATIARHIDTISRAITTASRHSTRALAILEDIDE